MNRPVKNNPYCKNHFLVKFDTPKVGKQLLHLILGPRAKSRGNEDFDVSILDPKTYSVLNLHTKCPVFLPVHTPMSATFVCV